MRIAYFINQYPKVSHSFIRREILALEKLGVEVHRWSLKTNPAELVDPLDLEELDKTRLLLSEPKMSLIARLSGALVRHPAGWFKALKLAFTTGYGSERGLLRHLAYFIEACTVVAWARDEKIEHVHAHFGTNPTTVVMLAKVLGGPSYSFTVHGPDEFDMPEFIALGEKIRRSAFTVAISSFGRSQLLRRISYEHWHKVVIVRCGLEKAFSSGDITPIDEARRFVCVGRLCEQKGQMLLIDAMRQLFDEGHEFDLVLAGDGPMRQEIEQRIERLHLSSHVKITGWISSEQVREQIVGARALVLPSFAEGLPVVIMEAMALKRPIITTSIAGIPELVVSGKTGWLVPAGTVAPLKQVMQDCLQAPLEDLRLMGEAARQQVLLQHDIDREAQKLLTHFKEHHRLQPTQSAASTPPQKPHHITTP